MRKLITLIAAVGASFGLASAAAASTFTLQCVGGGTACVTNVAPGTGVTLEIIMQATGISAYGVSVATTGSNTITAAVETQPPAFGQNFGQPSVINPNLAGTYEGTQLFGNVIGTFNIGTVTFTANEAGNVDVGFFNSGVDGVNDASGGPEVGTQFAGVTVSIVPEPTTASLLGLGLLGLVVAGRRRS